MTAPSGELTDAERGLLTREAATRALLPIVVVGLLGLAFLGIPRFSAIDPQLRTLAAACLSLFIAGFYCLRWRIEYTRRRDGYALARRQSTVLQATAQGITVQTSGPLGEASYDVAACSVGRISVSSTLAGVIGREVLILPSLVIQRSGATPVALLHGREQTEIQKVADALRETLRTSGDDADRSQPSLTDDRLG